MYRRALKSLLVVVLAAFTLSACEAVDSFLGRGKNPPDEFTVYQRAPLSIPPEFGLRPPQPGAPRPQDRSARGRAEAALTGRLQANAAQSNLSTGTQLLLEQTGALDVDPNIRLSVNEETARMAEEDQNITRQIMFWSQTGEYGQVIDADAESRRIKEGEAMGQSLNTIIRRK